MTKLLRYLFKCSLTLAVLLPLTNSALADQVLGVTTLDTPGIYRFFNPTATSSLLTNSPLLNRRVPEGATRAEIFMWSVAGTDKGPGNTAYFEQGGHGSFYRFSVALIPRASNSLTIFNAEVGQGANVGVNASMTLPQGTDGTRTFISGVIEPNAAFPSLTTSVSYSVSTRLGGRWAQPPAGLSPAPAALASDLNSGVMYIPPFNPFNGPSQSLGQPQLTTISQFRDFYNGGVTNTSLNYPIRRSSNGSSVTNNYYVGRLMSSGGLGGVSASSISGNPVFNDIFKGMQYAEGNPADFPHEGLWNGSAALRSPDGQPFAVKANDGLIVIRWIKEGNEAQINLGGLVHVYDSTPKSVTVSTNPVGLTSTVTYDGSSTQPTNAGSYEVVVNIDSNGYYGTQTSILTIQPRGLTATAQDQTKAQGQPNPVPVIDYSGFAGGDTSANSLGFVAPIAAHVANETSAPGDYAINVTGGSAANYTFTRVSGLLTVSGPLVQGNLASQNVPEGEGAIWFSPSSVVEREVSGSAQ